MELFGYPGLKVALLLLLQVIYIQRTQQVALNGNHVNDIARSSTSNTNETSPPTTQNELESPLIVLMSDDTISVAQLPMIEYGNISEIYQLLPDDLDVLDTDSEDHDQHSLARDEDDEIQHDARNLEEGGEDSAVSRGRNREHADAREYEQMPHQAATINTTTSNASLGKSQWQQIAASERDREEVWPPQPATQTNTNRKKSHEEDDDGHTDKRQLGQPRRRRSSNSLSDEELLLGNNGGAEPEASATSEAQTSRRVNRALESNAQQNVTSAPSGRQTLNLVLEEASADPTEDAGEGDKTSAASATHNQSPRHASSSLPVADQKRVRFSDFDVHMASGYAFAADSLGRIHRFKLPLSGKQLAGARLPASLMNNQHGRRIVSSSEDSSPGENDDTNAIDAGVKSGSSMRQSYESGLSDHQQLGARLNSTPAKAVASSASGRQSEANHQDAYENQHKEQSTNSNDDKVARREGTNDVTHEQFGNVQGQHPVISGVQNAPALARDATDDAAAASVRYSTLDQQLAALQSDNIKADAAAPRVIWSRNKYARAPLTASTSVSSSAAQRKSQRQQQLVNVEGASATAEGNQLADERTNSQSFDGPHLRGDRHHEAPDGTQTEQQSSGGKSGTGKRRQSIESRRFRTEIAVDWLNNLLFVLDKCRLLVMDFNGNNELVLIDDFTTAKRPIDIKFDPVYGILFWLQVGKFHNTIYKLDLSLLSLPSSTDKLVSNALYLRQSHWANDNGSNFDASDLVPLSSHNYAHPIITNLPRSAKVFTIDHKHSRIYVPLVSSQASDAPVLSDDRSEAEIFAATGNITHLNTTETEASPNDERDCQNVQSSHESPSASQANRILAYNLDGTDVGPFRAEESYLSKFDDMQDLTLDVKNNLLYWLTNSGRDLVEEAREGAGIQLSQHKLNNISYSKLLYFDNNGFNQPRSSKSRFNLRKLMDILSGSIRKNREAYSDGLFQFPYNVPSPMVQPSTPAKYTQNAPYIILGATCLIVVAVYMVYAFVIQQSESHLDEEGAQCRDGSVSGGSSSTGDSRVGSNLNGFINSSTISRWIAGPSAHSTDNSTFNRDGSTTNGPYDIESTNYEASNAIDEHYRDSIAQNSQLYGISSGPLANLNEWPTNMHDRSNKLYVPVEVLQDDALSSIRRVSIDQLEIEKTAPLGEGHFGTVLQGKIKCTLHERTFLLDKSQMNGTFNNAPISPDSLAPSGSRAFAVSSVSSGHGSSSSTSCEFTTANTCTEPTNDDDYLTPKTQLNSASSDYCVELPAHSSLRDDSCIEYLTEVQSAKSDSKVATKLRVAIKKLKDNASAEEKRDFLQEAKLLANFDHPNIVHLIGICLDRGSTLIVMELMLGGDLIRYMQESTPNSMTNNQAEQLTYDDLLKVCLDIANGCCYLEDMDYIHRDLAARNCLVSSRKREERVVKLADFGLARDIYKDSYYKKLNDSAMPLKWMAPECLIEQRFTKKSDVWSFGVVMWEVMSYCQEKPYVGVEPFFMKEHLASGARLRKPDYCDDDMYRLMNQCWHMEPENRPTFHECRAMLIEIRNRTRL